MTTLQLALGCGSGAMLGWGLADFLAKKTIDQIGDLATLFWGQSVGAMALFTIWTWQGAASLGSNTTGVLQLLGFGVVSALSYLLLYNGFAKGQVSVLSPIFASYAGLTALLSAVLLGERLALLVGLGCAVIFLGILILSADFQGARAAADRAGVPQVLGAMVVFSLWLVAFNAFLQNRHWLETTLVIRVVAALTLVVWAIALQRRHLRGRGRHRLHRPKRESLRVCDRQLWPYLAGIGLADVAAYSALAYGFEHSNATSVIALLSGAFSLPTIVLARYFLGERLSRQQVFAATVILGGIALVSGS